MATEIKNISPMSMAKVFAYIYGVFGLVYALFIILLSLFFPTYAGFGIMLAVLT